MSLTSQQKQQLVSEMALAERSIQEYFDNYLAKAMDATAEEIDSNLKEDYLKTSRQQFFSSAVSGVDSTSVVVKNNSKWANITFEEYKKMCQDKINNDPNSQKVLKAAISEWRTSFINGYGENAYYSLCEDCHCDLAERYVSDRLMEMQVDKVVMMSLPKSKSEYFINNMAKSSMVMQALGAESTKSYLNDPSIQSMMKKIYQPSATLDYASSIIGGITDTLLVTPGASLPVMASWCALDTFVQTVDTTIERNGISSEDMPAHKIIVKDDESVLNALFIQNESYSGNDIFEEARIISKNIDESSIKSREKKTYKSWEDLTFPNTEDKYRPGAILIQNKDKPFMEYNPMTASWVDKRVANTNDIVESDQPSSNAINADNTEDNQQKTENVISQTSEQAQQNAKGWESLGLDRMFEMIGFGKNEISRLLTSPGHTLASLPDDLLSGRSNPVLPILLLSTGLFSKNPMLKFMMFAGFAGSLFHNYQSNKQAQPQSKYKSYVDEELYSNITECYVEGNKMFMTVDGKSVIINLQGDTLEAYNSGALPRNTLANSIYDQVLAPQLANLQQQTNQETIIRSHAI